MSYEYDVFLSYRRGARSGPWTVNHFHPVFVDWLTEALGREAKVFFDIATIESGDRWSQKLQRALLRS